LILSIKNCGQTAPDRDMVTIDSIGSRQRPIRCADPLLLTV